ncbi:MAG TPA: hypothetical protein VK615_09570 [Candidatus Binatia bacterium]|nr:hypothetical protein [Candidatus Binatia bacterium]
MKLKLLALFWCCVLSAAAGTWTDALSRMPLPPNTVLSRDNCMRVVLEAFKSNGTVRAIAFLPGVSDDFYLLNREKPKLNAKASNLAEAIGVLTNLTDVRATFRDGLLLLHLACESVDVRITVKSERQAAKLKDGSSVHHVFWLDRHWDKVQPQLGSAIKIRIVPGTGSKDAWHFARCNVVGWNLNPWDLVTVTGLSSGTSVAIENRRVVFSASVSRRTG